MSWSIHDADGYIVRYLSQMHPEDDRQDHSEQEWAANPLADEGERRVIFAALDSFRQYRSASHLNTTHRRRQAFYALPQSHWQMLAEPPFNVLDNFIKVDDAIDTNAIIAEQIITHALDAYGLSPSPDKGAPDYWLDTASASDLGKANSTLRQFFRDWSAQGAQEREVCYQPVLNDLNEIFGHPPPPGLKVLLPGAGLGRLVLEVFAAGFHAEGNEISYHQLLASRWILNHTTKADEYDVYPFALNFNNLKSREQQLNKVTIPDVHPGTLVQQKLSEAQAGQATLGSMGMAAADFLLAYSEPSHEDVYDAVATVFFLDTAPNVIRYIETIRHCLKPGGSWINVGPLLWHFADRSSEDELSSSSHNHFSDKFSQGIAEPGRVELTEEEVRALVQKMGFEIVKWEAPGQECGYIQDPDSMLQTLYRPLHWVVTKVSDKTT